MSENKTKEKEMDDKKLQELYMQLTMLNQQTAEVQKQIQSIEEALQELEDSKKSIYEMTKAKKGKEVLVPVVPGIFIRTELKENQGFIVNVGAGTSVEKSNEEVQKLLDQQISQMQESQNSMIQHLQQLTVKSKQAEEELKSIAQR